MKFLKFTLLFPLFCALLNGHPIPDIPVIGKFNSDNIIKNKTAAIDKAAGAFNRNIKDVAGNNKIANTIANKLGFLR